MVRKHSLPPAGPPSSLAGDGRGWRERVTLAGAPAGRLPNREVQSVGPGKPARSGGPTTDPLLNALEELVTAAADVNRAVDMLTARATGLRAARVKGAQWRDVVRSEERPLIAEMLTETISKFESAGTRFRRAKARALHDEGMTMDQIADLFGVTRQRISVLLQPRPPAKPSAGDAAR